MKLKAGLWPVLITIAIVASLSSCRNTSQINESSEMTKVTGPSVLIYKTSADYQQHVPVILSPDKKSLVSYPAPGDVFFKGDLAYPLQLVDGYLLDRRGIGKDCAFLKWTYYEYSRLAATPTQEEIMKMILDDDPLTELYNCGKQSKYQQIETELNQLISEGKIEKFTKLK